MAAAYAVYGSDCMNEFGKISGVRILTFLPLPPPTLAFGRKGERRKGSRRKKGEGRKRRKWRVNEDMTPKKNPIRSGNAISVADSLSRSLVLTHTYTSTYSYSFTFSGGRRKRAWSKTTSTSIERERKKKGNLLFWRELFFDLLGIQCQLSTLRWFLCALLPLY